jgi:hypothetical protein
VPEYRLQLDDYYKQEYGESLLGAKEVVTAPESEEEEEDEEDFEEELEAEKKGTYENRKGATKRARAAKEQEKKEEEEQLETAESLLPRKKRKLLHAIKYGKRLKQGEITKLEEKKMRLEAGEAAVSKEGIIEYK